MVTDDKIHTMDTKILDGWIDVAKDMKWERGRIKYGGNEFKGNPIEELFDELVDALNYIDVANAHGPHPAIPARAPDTLRAIARRLLEYDNNLRRKVEEPGEEEER
jgi:hypothetical protein